MTFLMQSMRAALLLAAVLTLWSFLRVSAAMQTASDATGFAFVAVAFGMLGILAIGWAIAVAAIFAALEQIGDRVRRAARVAAAGLTVVIAVMAGYALTTVPGVDATAVAMCLTLGLGVPALVVLQRRFEIRSLFWSHGVPIAGTIAVVVCFVAAARWASATPTLREAVTQTSALLAIESRFLQAFGDGDGDGFAGIYGGADCDDDSADIHPGALEVPRNGIDEDCSGHDSR